MKNTEEHHAERMKARRAENAIAALVIFGCIIGAGLALALVLA